MRENYARTPANTSRDNVNEGGTCFIMWLWIFFDLWIWPTQGKLNKPAKCVGPRWFSSKFIVQTNTHTQRTSCFTWTTK